MIRKPFLEYLPGYAKLGVHYGLNNGEGIRPGEVVRLIVPEDAKPLGIAIASEIWKSGGHVMLEFYPWGINRSRLELSSDEQLLFYPKEYWEAYAKTIDHVISISCVHKMRSLEGIAPSKIHKLGEAMKPFNDIMDAKMLAHTASGTVLLYPSEAMAKEAGLTLEEYEDQIILACYLDEENPADKFKEIGGQLQQLKRKLDPLTPTIEKLHIIGEDVDLSITLGEKRQWVLIPGRNIPSFEIFISPDWRGTEGSIRFNQPLYRQGYKISDIRLTFKDGVVTEAHASENEEYLRHMISRENADKIGEFSLTPAGFSRISKPMASTLYDENMGGEFGNMHIALGKSYKESFLGDATKLTDAEFDELGFNDSIIHTDIVTTTDRTVKAILKNGEVIVLYENGKFLI